MNGIRRENEVLNYIQRKNKQGKCWNILIMYQLIPQNPWLNHKGVFFDHATFPSRVGRELRLLETLEVLCCQSSHHLEIVRPQWAVLRLPLCKFSMVQANSTFTLIEHATEPIKYMKTQKLWFGFVKFIVVRATSANHCTVMTNYYA